MKSFIFNFFILTYLFYATQAFGFGPRYPDKSVYKDLYSESNVIIYGKVELIEDNQPNNKNPYYKKTATIRVIESLKSPKKFKKDDKIKLQFQWSEFNRGVICGGGSLRHTDSFNVGEHSIFFLQKLDNNTYCDRFCLQVFNGLVYNLKPASPDELFTVEEVSDKIKEASTNLNAFYDWYAFKSKGSTEWQKRMKDLNDAKKEAEKWAASFVKGNVKATAESCDLPFWWNIKTKSYNSKTEFKIRNKQDLEKTIEMQMLAFFIPAGSSSPCSYKIASQEIFDYENYFFDIMIEHKTYEFSTFTLRIPKKNKKSNGFAVSDYELPGLYKNGTQIVSKQTFFEACEWLQKRSKEIPPERKRGEATAHFTQKGKEYHSILYLQELSDKEVKKQNALMKQAVKDGKLEIQEVLSFYGEGSKMKLPHYRLNFNLMLLEIKLSFKDGKISKREIEKIQLMHPGGKLTQNSFFDYKLSPLK
jgi:hypothetical protein